MTLVSLSAKASGPFCPSAPANCSFKNVQDGLKELKEDRFFSLLKSPDSACKGHLMQGVKPEAVMPELMADPRFISYVTPQIMQCWKEGGASHAKLETLARYAYIQRRFDENVNNLLDYQVFADSILGNEPLSSISDCKSAAPELAGFVNKCQELKSTCKKSNMAEAVAQSFMDDYKSQDIKAIETRLKDAQKILKSCNPRTQSGLTCKNAKEDAGRSAFRLQVFYANYPWAQEDKFQDMIGKRGVEDLALVTKALKSQVTENNRNITSQIKDLTTASKCLLRNNCDSDKVNDVLERTRPIADQYFLKKGESKESFKNRAAITQFVSYNNCLDDLGESQRKTSATMWSSGIGAVGAVVTMGGSLAVTGLMAGGRAVVGAASVGSRAASVGRMAITLGQATDGAVAAQSVYEASGHCGSKSTGYFKAAEKSAGPQACGIPTAAQMQFKKEYDGCLVDIVLGAAGGAGLVAGLKLGKKADQFTEAQRASTAALPTTQAAKAAGNIEKPAAQAAAATVAAKKAAAATGLGSSNLNTNVAQAAIQSINRGSSASTVRAVVGKLDDTHDGGAARLRIAEKVIGRELSEAERKWIIAAHNTHSDTAYGKIGSQKVRDKINAGEGRPVTLNATQTRKLMEYGVTGTETAANTARRADIPGSALNGRSNLTLEGSGKQLEVKILDSVVHNGEIWHKVEYPGPNGQTLIKPLKEADFIHMVKPQTETAAAKVADAVPTAPKPEPVVAAPTPAQPAARTPTQIKQDARPLNTTAANDIEALNQSQMKTVVNRNRPEVLNGKSTPKAERMRERYADDLGIGDKNRRAAIDYAPVADNKTMSSVLQKTLGSDSKVDAKQLRQMMSFNPGRGYVSPNEFANAARFVEEINAKGGVKALDKLPLSASEREVLNSIMERAPSYASYADPKVRPLGQVKIRKSPVDATYPDRDVVFTNSQGQTIQGKETIRQASADGENLSTIRVTNADGTTSTHTVRTTQTMDVAEAQRLQNYDRALTERANANRAAHVARTEQPAYVNPYGVARTEVQATREVTVKVHTLDGVKDVEAVVQGAPYKGINGTQEVQVRYPAGVENGKMTYKYTSVALDEIEQVKPVVTVVAPKVEAVPYKPISENVRKPSPAAMDPDSYDGKQFRRSVDQEAADIITDRRIGGAADVATLRKSIDSDYLLVREASARDRNVMYVSQEGMTSDKRFNPRIFYAHQSNEYHVAITAPKGTHPSGHLGQLEEKLMGTFRYSADGSTRTRVNSARDVALRAARSQNMSADEIAKLEKWMDDFDQAAPRIRAVEKAETAQKDFEAMKGTLQKALQNDSGNTPLTQTTFEKLARSMNDMMLTPEKKAAAEAALKKLKCSRPEWTIRDGQFSNFNLKCD